ncbi:hypothetical protein C6W10_14030 [Plantactinospora sp. BB1]|nr:hypothetical protein C6W10_14030 [Plantactinospora sp. BB1]
MAAQEAGETAEYIRRLVDGAPPLTEEQRARLAGLLAPAGDSRRTAAHRRAYVAGGGQRAA